jgi:hypothetical protein
VLVVAPEPPVRDDRPGGGGGERDEPAGVLGPGALERRDPDERMHHQVGGQVRHLELGDLVRRTPSHKNRISAWSRVSAKVRARPFPVTSSRSAMNCTDSVDGRVFSAAYRLSWPVYGWGCAYRRSSQVNRCRRLRCLVFVPVYPCLDM